ncbi:MAG: TIGR03032 family protein, partial [Gammaproteobacteria bacterium]|nr:TIGR03032 family protein [Gammaproteobacteria bacterium]
MAFKTEINSESPGSGSSTAEDEKPFRYVHSGVACELLERLGATLLVSTYQAGKLCVFRAKHGRLAMLPRTFDKAMG